MSLKMFIKSKTQRKNSFTRRTSFYFTLNQFFQTGFATPSHLNTWILLSVIHPSLNTFLMVRPLVNTQYRFVENLLHTQTAHADFWLTVFQNPFRSPADFLSPQKEENASKKGRSSGKKEEVMISVHHAPFLLL